MRRLYAAGLAATLTLGVAACSADEPKPNFTEPTGPGSPSATASSVPTGGASDPEEAARMWVDAWNEFTNTGEPGALRRISSNRCQSCKYLIKPALEVYRNGGRIRTEGWSIASVIPPRSEKNKDRFVDLAIDKAGGTNRKDRRSSPIRFDSDNEIIRFYTINDQDSFLISDLVTLQ